jgi:hypothetical protein
VKKKEVAPHERVCGHSTTGLLKPGSSMAELGTMRAPTV